MKGQQHNLIGCWTHCCLFVLKVKVSHDHLTSITGWSILSRLQYTGSLCQIHCSKRGWCVCVCVNW